MHYDSLQVTHDFFRLRNNDETFQELTFMLTTSSMVNSTPEKEFCALAVVTLPKISLYRYENSQLKFQSFSPQSSMVEFLLKLQFKLLFQCWKFGAIQADITHRRSTKLAYPGKSLELMVFIQLEDKACPTFFERLAKNVR